LILYAAFCRVYFLFKPKLGFKQTPEKGKMTEAGKVKPEAEYKKLRKNEQEIFLE